MMEKRRIRFVLLACIALVGSSWAQEIDTIDEARIDAATRAAFPNASADWLSRFKADQTLEACSRYRDAPPAEMAQTIAARESTTIQYPRDGKLIGDWKRGEQIAQSGYGLRFTDYPPTRENGGNCYACHQLTKEEVSYEAQLAQALSITAKFGDFPRPTRRQPMRRFTTLTRLSLAR